MEKITKFDLNAAFKALDEIESPVIEKSEKAKRLVEEVKSVPTVDALVEEYYDINSTADLENAKEERDEEIAKAKLAKIEKIVDLDAESPEDLEPSYEGKTIIQCPQCMTMFYKDPADVVISEDDPSLCNVGEKCQHCGNDDGYTIIGKVAPVEPEEAEKFEGSEEENDLNLDFEDKVPELASAEETEKAEEAKESFTSRVADALLEDFADEETLSEAAGDFIKNPYNKEPETGLRAELDKALEAKKDFSIKKALNDGKFAIIKTWANEHALEVEKVEGGADIKNKGEKLFHIAFITKESINNSKIQKEDEAKETLDDKSLEEEKINIDYVVSLFGDDSHYYKEDDEVRSSSDISGATKFNKKKDISILNIVSDVCESQRKYMPENEVAHLFGLDTLEEVYEKDEDYFISSGLVKIIPVYKNKKINLPESLKERLEADFEDEETDTCAWCGKEYPTSELHKEIDLGYLCPRCEKAIKSRGEKLIFDENLKEDKAKENLEEHINEELSDKELDKKLRDHNNFIEYIRAQIKQDEEALKKAGDNEEIKAAIQRRLDAHKEDLEKALPAAIKVEKAIEELPTPEEIKNESVNNKESLKEYFDDPDYWSDKIGPTYLISYNGKPVCYIEYPYAGEIGYGGEEPSNEEILFRAKEVLNKSIDLEKLDLADNATELDDSKISYEYDENTDYVDVPTIKVAYGFKESLNKSKIQKDAAKHSKLETENHSKNLTLNESSVEAELNKFMAGLEEACKDCEESGVELNESPVEEKKLDEFEAEVNATAATDESLKEGIFDVPDSEFKELGVDDDNWDNGAFRPGWAVEIINNVPATNITFYKDAKTAYAKYLTIKNGIDTGEAPLSWDTVRLWRLGKTDKEDKLFKEYDGLVESLKEDLVIDNFVSELNKYTEALEEGHGLKEIKRETILAVLYAILGGANIAGAITGEIPAFSSVVGGLATGIAALKIRAIALALKNKKAVLDGHEAVKELLKTNNEFKKLIYDLIDEVSVEKAAEIVAAIEKVIKENPNIEIKDIKKLTDKGLKEGIDDELKIEIKGEDNYFSEEKINEILKKLNDVFKKYGIEANVRVEKTDESLKEELPSDVTAAANEVINKLDALNDKAEAEIKEESGVEEGLEEAAKEEPKFDFELPKATNAEFKKMINSKTFKEFGEEINGPEASFDLLEEVDEKSFNENITKFLTAVYENVDTFETKSCSLKENKLIVEGKINFKSGNTNETVFEFVVAKSPKAFPILEGYNKTFAEGKIFTVDCIGEDGGKRLLVDHISYKYNIGENLIEGLTK